MMFCLLRSEVWFDRNMPSYEHKDSHNNRDCHILIMDIPLHGKAVFLLNQAQIYILILSK